MKSLGAHMYSAEATYLKKLLKQHPDFNITQMAITADITRLQLYRILDRHNIKVPKYDQVHHTRKKEEHSATSRLS